MIQCPDCGKDIADDSAHCGFCGAKIETGAGKKTMMGFAALTGDRLKEAAEEARRAREEAEAEANAAAPSAPADAAKPSLSLPSRPTKPVEESDGRPKLPNIPRPTPQAGTPMAPPDLNKLSIGSPGDTDDSAPTAVMAAVPGDAPSTVNEEAVTGGPDFAADTNPDTPPDPEPAPQTVPVVPPAQDTLPERDALDGPTEFGGGPTVDGPSEFGTGSNVVIPENTLPEKKKNPVVIIVGVIAVMTFLCCALSLFYTFLVPMLM